jgi:hypothetical protein
MKSKASRRKCNVDLRVVFLAWQGTYPAAIKQINSDDIIIITL